MNFLPYVSHTLLNSRMINDNYSTPWLFFSPQMDPNRISEDDTHCINRIFKLHENADLQDTTLENQDTKLIPDSCKSIKQAFRAAVQKVSPHEDIKSRARIDPANTEN